MRYVSIVAFPVLSSTLPAASAARFRAPTARFERLAAPAHASYASRNAESSSAVRSRMEMAIEKHFRAQMLQPMQRSARVLG